MQGISERITDIAERLGREPALISFLPDGTQTVLQWAQLERRTQDRARAIAEAVRPAGGLAVVCVAAHKTASTVIDILAAARARLPVFPLDPGMPMAVRARMLRQLTASYGPVLTLRGNAGEIEQSPVRAVADVSYFLATGGTSGQPKIVKHPGPLTYDPRLVPSGVLRRARWQSGQRQLIVGPLYHAAPFSYFLTGLLDANTVILPPRFEPDRTWKILSTCGVQWFQLTPTHMARLADSPACAAECLRHVHGILHTAAACPHQLKRRWIELAGPDRIFELYTATEAIGSTLASGEEWLRRPGTVGRGMLTQIRILDEQFRPLPRGSVGRVFMRGPRQRSGGPGYLGDVAAAETADGFRSVGDYGRLDEDGYLFLEPRREDMVTVGGKNVYPADVEKAIAEHPLISDVAVFGVPDAVFGTKIVAVISTHDDRRVGIADLVVHCQGRLAVYQMPRKVHRVAHVPRNDAGKLERWRLASAFPEASPASPEGQR
jgi:bile acid-coenzyme A ligase